jgi:hypothetical protein
LVLDEEVARISKTDLRGNEKSGSDFIVNVGLASGNRAVIYGSLENARDKAWLSVLEGDRIAFAFKSEKHGEYRGETATGGEYVVEYQEYSKCTLLDRFKGSAATLPSFIAPEDIDLSCLKQPKAKTTNRLEDESTTAGTGEEGGLSAFALRKQAEEAAKLQK